MLRYRLPPAALLARELMFVAIAQGQEGMTELQPQLQVWVELETAAGRRFVMAVDNVLAALDASEGLQMIGFAPGALASANAAAESGFMFVELTTDLLDVRLLGEALVVGT